MGANDGKWIFSTEIPHKTVSSTILSHPTHHFYIIFDSSRDSPQTIIITKSLEKLQLDRRLKYEIKKFGFIFREKATNFKRKHSGDNE